MSNFSADTKATLISLEPVSTITVSEIHFSSVKGGGNGAQAHDIVFITLGSMTSASSIGTNTTPPKSLPTQKQAIEAPDGAWQLWSELANSEVNPHFSHFGNPSNFYTRVNKSNWLSFTAALKHPEFFDRLERNGLATKLAREL
jgi:oleate hydratase